MGEALAEARIALAAASARSPRSPSSTRRWSRGPTTGSARSNDPTAHAVVVALREAARKLGRHRLADATIFATLEPCAMCVGALLESDVEALVFAVPNRATAPPAPSSSSPSTRPSAPDQDRQRHPPRRGRGAFRSPATAATAWRPRADLVVPIGRAGRLCYPLPRRGVRVVDGAALEKRCAKAPRVRIPPSPPGLIGWPAGDTAGRLLVSRGRGRLVDYGAALEMRFGATRRGFKSRPLRHSRPTADRRRVGDRPRSRRLL